MYGLLVTIDTSVTQRIPRGPIDSLHAGDY